MSLPKRVRDRGTKAQLKKLRETRDCPCDGCSGTLSRTDIWEHDYMIIEEYKHSKGGCECSGTVHAIHYRGRSRGRGCLQGEF